MGITIVKKPYRGKRAPKIFYTLSWGRGPGERDKVSSANVTFVGHSLGGGLAITSAMLTGGDAVTFNPAWVSAATAQNLKFNVNSGHIDNYIIAGEILDVS